MCPGFIILVSKRCHKISCVSPTFSIKGITESEISKFFATLKAKYNCVVLLLHSGFLLDINPEISREYETCKSFSCRIGSKILSLVIPNTSCGPFRLWSQVMITGLHGPKLEYLSFPKGWCRKVLPPYNRSKAGFHCILEKICPTSLWLWLSAIVPTFCGKIKTNSWGFPPCSRLPIYPVCFGRYKFPQLAVLGHSILIVISKLNRSSNAKFILPLKVTFPNGCFWPKKPQNYS